MKCEIFSFLGPTYSSPVGFLIILTGKTLASLVSLGHLPHQSFFFFKIISTSPFVDSALASSYHLSLSFSYHLTIKFINRMSYILIVASYLPLTVCPSDFLLPHQHNCFVKGFNALSPPAPNSSLGSLTWLLRGIWYCELALQVVSYSTAVSFTYLILWVCFKSLV